MWIEQSYARPSAATQTGSGLNFALAPQEQRPPVRLKCTIGHSPAYARAMLALFEVVKSDARFRQKDHTAYQEWVRGEYLRELSPQLEARRQALPGQMQERDALRAQIAALEDQAKPYRSKLSGHDLWDAKRKYWKWLYSRNRDLWFVLDPVVSFHPDAVIFEAFSQDESAYGRVTVPSENLDIEGETVYGTTNVDFSDQLANEIRRVRSYHPARLEVEGGGVAIATDAGSRLEKKIDLPPTWVRGFLQVQSAATLPGVSLTLSASTLADVLLQLRLEREKQSPRALKFILETGRRPRLVIEPWNIEIEEPEHIYEGDTQEIRLWGRRRLFAVQNLLGYSDRVQVRLLGTGMPSFWSVENDGHRFDIGLSGWTKNDWSGAARFDLLAATAPVTEGDVELARGQLEKALRLSPEELSARSDLSREAATAALQQVCREGDAMFDPIGEFYRWRKLLPPGAAALAAERDPKLEFAKQIVKVGGVKFLPAQEDDFRADTRGEATKLRAQVSTPGRDGSLRRGHQFETTVEVDPDGRISFAACTCAEFRRNKLKKGPCAHILSVAALASGQVAGARAARSAGQLASGPDPEHLKGLTFCFTGALKLYSREQAETLVEAAGGKAASGVSKGLSYLVAGDKAGSKLIKAKLLGVKVLTEEEFKQLLEGKAP